MNHDVFISYSNEDRAAAQAVCHCLEQNNIRCWMAPRDITPGMEYGDLIDDAIKYSKVVVVLYSAKSASSSWVKGEINIAFEEQKTIIPFRLDKTPLTGQSRVMLNQKHWIDAFPDYKTKFRELVNAVSKMLGKQDLPISGTKEFSVCRYFSKSLIISIVSLLLIGLSIGCYLLAFKEKKIFFDYNREGLHIKISAFDKRQASALKSILDNMVLVEGGTFVMGNDNRNRDFFTVQDSLSSGPHCEELGDYYIGKFEITQWQWNAFLPLDACCLDYNDNHPVDNLSWEDAKAFADTLSHYTGLMFSLPTEAQWEYAARGGKKSKGYLFSGADDPARVGWTSCDSIVASEMPGQRLCNELGLFDMTGNVSEWCLDDYFPYMANNSSIVVQRDTKHSLYKVYRGGDFRMDNLYDLKTTTRYYCAPFTRRKATGLRLVINIE